jgi:hypothetical protein
MVISILPMHPNYMKHTRTHITTTLAALVLTATTHAAVTFNDSYSNPGTDGNDFLYLGKLTASDNSISSYNTTLTTGGWSFADLRGTSHTMFGSPISGTSQGWGHASRWFLLEITQATQFTLSMTPWNDPGTLGNEATDARPGFVIFAGESVEDVPSNAHTYNNDGTNMALNDGWDKNGPGGTRGLTYVTNGYNAAGGSLTSGAFLSPGLYTIALGNIGDSLLATGNKGFDVTFAVPEPSSAILALSGSLIAFRRRRR